MLQSHHRASLAPILLSLVLGTIPALQGCAANQRTPATEAYAAGNYRDAYYNALAEQRLASSDAIRSQAGLTAGLAAYAMAQDAANDADRDRWLQASSNALTPLVGDPDPTISGRALAALGLGNALRGRFAESADQLNRAGTRLSGEEAARANFHAGLSYELAGSTAAARRSFQAAITQATDPALRRSIEARLGSSAGAAAFTIQVGAFSTQANADHAAAEAARRARAAGLSLGEPSVIVAPGPSGRTLYRVQIGRFTSRNDAIAARVRFAPEATITHIGG